MRLFAALVPPPEALEHLDEFLDVRRAAGEFRWVQAEQFHVTLAFLADVPERKLDDLVERLARAAAQRTAFETAIAGGGAFPNAGGARVLWAGLDLDEPGRTELDRLATGCRAAANRAGIAVDGAAVPAARHLARLRSPAEVVAAGSGCSTATPGPRWPATESRWSRRTSARARAAGPGMCPWTHSRSTRP